MSDLLNAHEIIEKSLEEIGAKTVGINTEENAIALYVEDADSYDVTLVKEISPVKNIILREMRGFSFLEPSEQGDENKNARASDVVAGDWISVRSSTNGWSTLATSVCYDYGGPNQQIGYVTCGHGYKVGDQTWYGGAFLGTVSKVLVGGTSSSATTQKCRTDASFIPSSRLHTGKTKNGKIIATHDVPVAGKYVDVIGAKSGVISRTKILDTNVSGWWGDKDKGIPDYYLKDAFTFAKSPQGGDSGAAICYTNSDGTYAIVGIVEGGYYDENDVIRGAGIKWANVSKDLNVIAITRG